MKTTRILKSLTGLCCALALLVALAVPIGAVPAVDSGYYMLMDAATGQVLYEKNADTALSPSGLVKLMTALIAFENTADLTNKLTVSQTALSAVESGYRTIGLTAGELIPMSDCLYAMLLSGATDASNVVGEAIGNGSISTFVTMMNMRAAELGLTATSFANPSGITASGQTSSCRDLALILRAGLANQNFASYFATTSYTVPATNNNTRERDLKARCLLCITSEYKYDGIAGGMYANSTASQHVLAATAVKDGRQLIVVVMKGESESATYKDAIALLNFGFTDFASHTLVASNLNFPTIPVTQNGVKVGEATLTAQSDITFLLRTDFDLTKLYSQGDNIPTSIDVSSSDEYTAKIVYKADDGTETVLAEDIALVKSVTMLPTETTAGTSASTTEASTVVVTDASGNVITDASGNPVTSAVTTAGGFISGVGRFFKVFFIIILIIIAVVLGLALIAICALYAIRYYRRAQRKKKREAEREQRAAQRAERGDNSNDQQ